MLGTFLKPEYEELVRAKDWATLREAFSEMDPADISEIIEDFGSEDAGLLFRLLPRDRAAQAFEYLPVENQTKLVEMLGTEQMVAVLNEMAPDDRTRLFEELPAEVTKRVLTSLRPDELKVARQLLGYPEDSAGRFMTPEYLPVRPTMTAAQALEHIRKNGKDRETLSIVYVVDEHGVLFKDLKLSTLVFADPSAMVGDLEDRPLVSILATADREQVVKDFEKYDRVALPVTDTNGVLLGIITVDDVLDVVEEEATEDIQKMGGLEALDAPYLEVRFKEMIRKRGVWLAVLFLGEMLTATAMGYFEHEIQRAVVLALFIPLIISSGGNSGSQATSLIIRALAVEELGLKDWWRVLRRELVSGATLGLILGAIGFLRIILWPNRNEIYGPNYIRVATTVSVALVGVVLFGTVTGSMLPFILRRVGVDPATASAPFVATLVDVSGLVIYFSVASLILFHA